MSGASGQEKSRQKRGSLLSFVTIRKLGPAHSRIEELDLVAG